MYIQTQKYDINSTMSYISTRGLLVWKTMFSPDRKFVLSWSIYLQSKIRICGRLVLTFQYCTAQYCHIVYYSVQQCTQYQYTKMQLRKKKKQCLLMRKINFYCGIFVLYYIVLYCAIFVLCCINTLQYCSTLRYTLLSCTLLYYIAV